MQPLVPSASSPLLDAFERQEEQFASAITILRDAIAQYAFPATAIAVTQRDRLIALKTFGHFTHEPNSPPVRPNTLFDLASLTKVVATTTMAMILYERGLLDLDLPVVAVAAEFAGEDPRRDAVTLRMLLAHSSGLPAHEKLFL